MSLTLPVVNFAKSTPKRSDLHWARRCFHAASGLSVIGLSLLIPDKHRLITALILITLAAILIEGLRMASPQFNRFILIPARPFIREGEESRLTGVVYYLIGCVLAFALFPRLIAVLSILYLAVGDPIASIVGITKGRLRLPENVNPMRKSLEGSIACFLSCTMITFFVSFYFERTAGLGLADRIYFGFLGGFSAALGEFLPLKTDDNLALPLISGTSLWVTAAFLNLVPGLYI